jgi:hypothetical protein
MASQKTGSGAKSQEFENFEKLARTIFQAPKTDLSMGDKGVKSSPPLDSPSPEACP